MYKIEIVNKKTKEVITYNNVDDKNNGEKLYYKFEIDATTLVDGEYTINVYNDDDIMVCSDTLNVGEFNNKLQYERGSNIYISTNLDVTTEDKYVTLTSIELTVKPTDGVDAMTSVIINAQPIYDDAYNDGYNNGATDGYDEGVREQKSKLTSIDITKNGTYTTEDGYSNVNVNVQPETYSYKVNTVDEDGLRQLGWDDASINYFKDNSLHYVTENDAYVVTDENLALKNVIKTADDLESLKNKKGLVFLPYVDTSDRDNFTSMFNECKELESIPLINLKKTTETANMFLYCESLKTIPPLDTSNIINMASMFGYCFSLDSIPMLNTSKVTNMDSMFEYCTALTSIPQLDTSKVTNMNGMFYQCKVLKSIPPLDTSNVINMTSTFSGCHLIKYIPQLDTSKVTSMQETFSGCHLIKYIPPLDTSNVTNMRLTFSGCHLIKYIPPLDTSKVTSMWATFASCYALETIPPLDTSNVKDMDSMFSSCKKLKTIPLLNTSKVTNMVSMFRHCTALTSIPQLDTSKVISVNSMFYDVGSSLKSLPLLDFGSLTVIYYFFGYTDCLNLTDLGGFKNLKITWTDGCGLNRLPNLTYQSVMNVINNLYDFRGNGDTSTTRTIRFHSNSLALLTDDDKAVATAKGWVLTS